MWKVLTLIINAFFLFGCSLTKKQIAALETLKATQIKDSIIVNPPFYKEPTSNSKNFNYISINCLYATDRNKSIKNSRPTFGTDRSSEPELHFGTCNVSIPRNHAIGDIESPSLLKFELNEDPNKHISVVSINSLNKNVFFDEVRNRISKSKQNDSYVFIHGYNVSFEAAAKKTAQLYYDLSLKGIPIFYSWPSQNELLKYTVDSNNSEWSIVNFKFFLKELIEKTKTGNIYLIAHSMGNRLLMGAISDLVKENRFDKTRLKEIILVAPDVDLRIFKRDYAPYSTNQGLPITLYISSKDRALLASKIVNGDVRVGDAGNKPLIIKGIETVDATNADTDILGHSYFSNSRPVADDIFYLINNRLRASQRRLVQKTVAKGVYWEFTP